MMGFDRYGMDLQTQFRAAQTQFRAAERAAFAVPNPNAHFKPSGVIEHAPIMGMPVLVSRFVPEGTILMVNGRVYVDSEYTVLKLRLGYEPLFSKHTLGTKEVERDRRRHA